MAIQINPEDTSLDRTVTPEKIDEAVRRIVTTANPLQVILFGSRARGDHRPDSDVDLAAILDVPEEEVRQCLPWSTMNEIGMEVTLIAVSKEKFDLFRPWRNSVFNYIDKEGIILYDRDHPESARPDALHLSRERSIDATVSLV